MVIPWKIPNIDKSINIQEIIPPCLLQVNIVFEWLNRLSLISVLECRFIEVQQSFVNRHHGRRCWVRMRVRIWSLDRIVYYHGIGGMTRWLNLSQIVYFRSPTVTRRHRSWRKIAIGNSAHRVSNTRRLQRPIKACRMDPWERFLVNDLWWQSVSASGRILIHSNWLDGWAHARYPNYLLFVNTLGHLLIGWIIL